MKKIIKSMNVLLLFVLLLCFSGCGNNSYNGGGERVSVTSSEDAVYEVKNYLSGTDYSLKNRIARTLGFNNFYDPSYGTSSAIQNEDGSWSVSIKGSMTGYVDEYHNDIETYQFEVSATVSESGSVKISVRKAY